MIQAIKNIFQLGKKEILSLCRDGLLMALIVYSFTAAIIVASNASTDFADAAIAVVDEDQSQLSQRLSDAFQPPLFLPVETRASEPGRESHHRPPEGLEIGAVFPVRHPRSRFHGHIPSEPPLRQRVDHGGADPYHGIEPKLSCFRHVNNHAGAAPAQIGMKTEAAEFPVS